MTEHPQTAFYFSPPTHHFFGDRLFDRKFAGHAGDEILAPYVHLKEYLNSRGVAVHTSDRLPSKPDGTRNIVVASGFLDDFQKLSKRPDVVLSAFFALECPTVEPGLYRELGHTQHLFKRIYSWSDSESLEPYVGGPLRCLPMRWPQSFESVHEGIWKGTDRGFMVVINGNKLPRYKSPGRELYSERVRAIQFFGATGDVDLYGVGWDGPTFRVGQWFVPGTFGKIPMPGTAQFIIRKTISTWHKIAPDPRLVAARKVYRGFANSKSQTLGKYKFALCFENSILRGWTTEKIFDCFFAGTVPVYWGAPDIQEYVPADCFIDMREFKDYEQLRNRLKSLTDRDITRYKENARAFLGSPRFKPFAKQTFAEMIGRIVEEDSGTAFVEPAECRVRA